MPDERSQTERSSLRDGAEGVTVRPLRDLHEYRQCLTLQELTWGEDFVEKVPPLLMKVVDRNGGVVGGALNGEGELLGFVFGIAGLEHGRSWHWSHMLAVHPESRGRGLGRRLKLFQRDFLLEHGLDLAKWTYDPLVARNAHLNFNRLGVESDDYVVNMYGEETGSRLHQGLGTDRFVVRWELESERTRRSVSGERREPSGDCADAPAVVERGNGAGPMPVTSSVDGSEAVRVEIPRDIQRIRDESPDAASAWREATRRAFRRYLQAGYSVDGLLRTNDGRCFYVLRDPAAFADTSRPSRRHDREPEREG